MKTIALFGGSFDPPHIGHIKIVEALKKLSFIDKVVVMPTYQNPFKSSFSAPPYLRLQWLRDIFKNDTQVEVNSYEVDLKKATPTIESVLYLNEFYDKIYVVIGADNLGSLKKWHRYEELKKMVNFIVVTRNDMPLEDNFLTLTIQENISSTQLRRDIQREKLPKECAAEIEKYYKEKNDKQNRKDNERT